MKLADVYKSMSERTKGEIFIGVVGPVRTGKSTFIKNFMEKMIIPAIDDPFLRERTKDELPQSGSGRTIMTAEPKFVPDDAIAVEAEPGLTSKVRLVDCVGYMINGASGNIENGSERMVMTPWHDHEIPISAAAEEGTRRVISDHSNVAVVVTTDGSVCGIPRSDYIAAEAKTVEELRRLGKPYVVILNCADPDSETSLELAAEISDKYNCECVAMNCLLMGKEDIAEVLSRLLNRFPAEKFCVRLPEWLEVLNLENKLKKELYSCVLEACSEISVIGERNELCAMLCRCNNISSASIADSDASSASIDIRINMPRDLYYKTLSEESGYEINNDHDLISILSSVSSLKEEYERVHSALEDVREYGYGIVMPGADEMQLEEPQISKLSGRYGVKLKATAPSIHMIRTMVETEVSPAIGGEKASEDMINFLIQGFDGDMSRIWESNIFGKSLNDIAGEALAGKIKALPPETKLKLKSTLEKIVNDGSRGLICIIL